MLKRIFIFIFVLFLALSVSAQDNTIKLTVSGEGTTREEATANALRSAIEQSFGTFVSANTQFLNDEVVKEEIATVASGNIKGYQELSDITLPNGGRSVMLSATVSLGNLISYSKSKGSTAEFAGAAFTMNMRMRKLNAENEITALYNMLDLLYELFGLERAHFFARHCFNFFLVVALLCHFLSFPAFAKIVLSARGETKSPLHSEKRIQRTRNNPVVPPQFAAISR
jgi:hypothetical protein